MTELWAELEIIRQTQPNDPRVFDGRHDREASGRWEESTQNLERALDLDPRNIQILQQLALSYEYLRRYAEEKLILDRVLAIVPNDAATKQSARWWN